MYGSLLGDASSTAVGFTCEHSVNQAGYLAWKQSVLCGLGDLTFDRKERKVPSTIARRADPVLAVADSPRRRAARATRSCGGIYGGQDEQKHVSNAWLARVGGLGVTAWVLDYGSITNRVKKGGVSLTGNIATHGFVPEDRERLAAWLSGHTATPARSTWPAGLAVGVPEAAMTVEVARWVPWRSIPGSKKFLAQSVARIQVGGAAAGDRLDVPAGPRLAAGQGGPALPAR